MHKHDDQTSENLNGVRMIVCVLRMRKMKWGEEEKDKRGQGVWSAKPTASGMRERDPQK